MAKVRKVKKKDIFFINKILSADNRKIQVGIKVKPAKQGGGSSRWALAQQSVN